MNTFLEKLMREASPLADNEDHAKCVIRLTTSNYLNGSEIVFKKTLCVLKRKSQLDLQENGIDDIEYVDIANLNEVEDGVYELQPCEFDTDGDEWNTWHYPVRWKLVPFQ